MQRTINNLSDDDLERTLVLCDDYASQLEYGVPAVFTSLTALGLNRANVRDVAGYRLAEVCRAAAVKLEEIARYFEECEDAYHIINGHDGRGQP